MPTADYDAGCRVRSTSTKCPTRKSKTSSSPPISRPENALASRLLFRQFSKSSAKTCKSGSRKALLHLALESRQVFRLAFVGRLVALPLDESAAYRIVFLLVERLVAGHQL